MFPGNKYGLIDLTSRLLTRANQTRYLRALSNISTKIPVRKHFRQQKSTPLNQCLTRARIGRGGDGQNETYRGRGWGQKTLGNPGKLGPGPGQTQILENAQMMAKFANS